MTSVRSGSAAAPTPPGRLGRPLEAPAALSYLEALEHWCTARRGELDELDRAVLASPEPAAATGDVALAMALWQSISQRYAALLDLWDSGRAGLADRERMAALIWGRLDSTVDPALLGSSAATDTAGSSLVVSLPEACRLCDTLTSALRARLAWTGSAAEVSQRVRQLRAQLERIREQVALEPAGLRHQEAAGRASALARRLSDLAAKADRGGDIGGQLAPLEIEATRYERDLIVEAAQRRESAASVRQARTLRADLRRGEDELRALAERCVATVHPAPNYAVPDVDALGPVPNTAAALETYLARLAQVSRAMTVATEAYARALSERDALRRRLDAGRAEAEARGLAQDEDLHRAYALAGDLLTRRPVRMGVVRVAVELYEALLGDARTRPGRAGQRGSGEPA